MADASDSKSDIRKSVKVQVLSPAVLFASSPGGEDRGAIMHYRD
jgi:hypothetical protein